ncbi:aldehyde dehydrogenase family protein [Salsipaludibacter albus]|uniref:aldehyde dehydrogenase family protein n=1 Tax=Salsipaludibacter albus TaxID=2849650 RepID=UPI001EE4C11B|nr:aldehyde dehydrogenase family protein [Salsipaludibacter albus]MBY5162249.1 aldehyde dehydrogenase family protein [Salsipaludibacter albus]
MTSTDAATDRQAGTPDIPQVAEQPTTSPDELDRAVAVVAGAAPGWVTSDLPRRLALLEQARGDTLAAAEDWVLAAQVAKGISRDQRAMGDEWLGGPALVARNLRLLHQTLTDVVTTGRPQPPRIEQRDDGRTVVHVLPADGRDRLLLPRRTGQVVMREGVTVAEVESRIGEVHRDGHEPPHEGEVAVVLGAGNVSSIPPMDVLAQLYGHLRTVVLKMSPVNDWLAPHLRRALRAFVDADLVRIVSGGRDEGAHLVGHDDVAAVHVTGSDRTHDAIVFGTGEEGARRRAADEPVMTKTFTAELGNVSPVIVVPGPWTDDDLAAQGDTIASMLVNNGGFNCVAARVVVTHVHWNRRGRLLDAVRASLAEAEDRQAWYPGAEERHRELVASHDRVEGFGGTAPGSLPFTLLADLDPSDTGHLAFTHEAFCGVFGEVGLDAPRSVVDYLEEAVDFANDVLWGTLSASILVHPRSLRDPAIRDAVERAIDRLEYGTVVVNDWGGTAYGTVVLPWGGAPGRSRTDIQSGTGFVHNTWLLPDDLVEKSVLRSPFRPTPGRITSHTHARSAEVGRLLTEFEATGRTSLMARLAVAAARG